jgi:iron complex transport system substrate-binding protein
LRASRAARQLAGAGALTLIAAAPLAAEMHTVIDSAGRRVQVPVSVGHVYAAGGPAAILLYTLAPEKMVGWTRALGAEERAFVPARYADLPTLGRLTGRGNTANAEVVLSTRPDLVFDYGTLTETYRSLADRMQQQTGLPYLLFDGSLSAIPEVYTRVGDVLGVGDRGRELAQYAARLLADVDRHVASVPPAQRPSVYYARGPKGLDTAARGSINVESLERLGARNVADKLDAGLISISPEQVLAWDPEVIVAIDRAFAASVRTDPVWKNVRAVRERRVYLVPQAPFPWVDFPPSVNRLIGLKWLGRVLYPAHFPEDLRQETRAFYGLFYHQTPTEAQLDALLAGLDRAAR